MAVDRFKRGTGCYTCKSCGKRTRETGEGESSCEMCRRCYDIGGYENSLSDGGHPDAWGNLFDGCKTTDEVRARYLEECKKHGIVY